MLVLWRELGDYIIYRWQHKLLYEQVVVLCWLFRHLRYKLAYEYYWIYLGKGMRGLGGKGVDSFMEVVWYLDELYRDDIRWDKATMRPRDIKNWRKVMVELIESMSRTTEKDLQKEYPNVVNYFKVNGLVPVRWYNDGNLIRVDFSVGKYNVRISFMGAGVSNWEVKSFDFFNTAESKNFSRDSDYQSKKGKRYLLGLDFEGLISLVKSGEAGIDRVIVENNILVSSKIDDSTRKGLQRILASAEDFIKNRSVGGR